jgi:putative intracellular protease/amidase
VQLAFLLFPGVTQLDLTGPVQLLSRLPGTRVDLVWDSLDPVPTDAGFSIVPGSPAKAGPGLVEIYTKRANRLAPQRRADLIAAATRLGFGPPQP